MVVTSGGGGSLNRNFNIDTVAFELNWGAGIDPIVVHSTNTTYSIPIVISAESGMNTIVTVKAGETTIATRNITGSRTISVNLAPELLIVGVNTITASMVSATDETDTADDIRFMLIYGYGATTPIVTFANDTQTCTQYEVANIDYFVYDPNNETTTCTI